MKIYHQTGFRHNWNIEAYNNGIGDGLIFSPVNIDADKLRGINEDVKKNSFLDPQLYLLNEAKGTLDTYPYFPGNIQPDFSTPDLDNSHVELAKLCIDYQIENNFKFVLIPTRYYEDNPTNYFSQSSDYFVDPFCSYLNEKNNNKPVLLSIIVKTIMLKDEQLFNEVLNWATGHQKINGVYLIFENNFPTKQIKDFDYLLNALRLIEILKRNDLQVHIGYANTESILYSIASPDSITIGSYDNLRSFGIKRFNLEKSSMRAPNARLYSSKLLQWVDYEYIQAMSKLIPDYDDYFDNSIFKPLMFQPEFNWHFMKAEPYKHYFDVFSTQIRSLPIEKESKIREVKKIIKTAISNFADIESLVLLDENSDGSHLPTWFNVINAYLKKMPTNA